MLDADVVQLLESGCACMVGTVDGSGAPRATRGWGIEVEPGGDRLRVLLEPDPVAIENLRTGGRVAVTATDVPTLRSVQVKGGAVAVEPATPHDRRRFERHADTFCAVVHETDGTPVALLRRLVPREPIVFVMTADELYDQTPGPTAGARLAPSGRPA